MEEDYFLTFLERKEIIAKLRALNFDSFKVNAHFYNKFGLPRPGVTLQKAKEIFLQFDKIYQIFTRKGIGGKRYSVIYRFNKNKGYYLIFLLDESLELFDAYFFSGDVEKRLRKKYFGF